MNSKKIIWGTLLLGLAAWLAPQLNLVADWDVWIWRKQLIYFTGLASFLLMSLVMLLAARPRWLETPIGGLDKMYQLHKWAGIWSVVLALLHYGIKLAKGPMLTAFGEATKEHRIKIFLEIFRGSAKDLGEWSLWVFAAMVVLALIQRFPYHLWRYVHKALAVFYLVIVFHSIVLTPPQWWLQPAGMLIAVAAVLGSYAAVLSLTGNIGRQQRWQGKLLASKQLGNGCLELVCQLPPQWRHQAGQFAFLRMHGFEGAHPFTIASADQGDGQIKFAIKGLGDYTNRLADIISIGQRVEIEGPYGRFGLTAEQSEAPQVWIGAGIGITPFLAWLESLQNNPALAPKAKLYYCVNNEQEAVFAERLQQLCSMLPSIELHLHYSQQQGHLSAEQIFAGKTKPQVWFCGPEAFANALHQGAEKLGLAKVKIHQEAFRMR